MPQTPRQTQQVNELELQHVYGYRGFDCRDNLHYLEDSNEIVYHAGAVCIMLNLGSGNCGHTRTKKIDLGISVFGGMDRDVLRATNILVE